MRLVILPQASTELMEAVEYYEAEQSGLGERLWHELDRHLEWIAENPTLPRLRSGGYRRVNLVLILSISHAARLPEHWIDRK